jgi:hypothetical protein
MTATATISALLRDLPAHDRASLAVELIDSLGDAAWDDDQLAKLAEERDAELESASSRPSIVRRVPRRPEPPR